MPYGMPVILGVASLVCVLTSCITSETNTSVVIKDDYDVMENGKIVESTGFGMGVDDKDHRCNWVKADSISLNLNYPGGLGWGAVFLTVGGNPTKSSRSMVDVSACAKLVVEMRGAAGGEEVRIGIKDSEDPDDGNETKKTVTLTGDWKSYVFALSEFTNCDLTRLYVVTEFVFPGGKTDNPASVEVKSIRFLKE
jgi:hypothetical protein